MLLCYCVLILKGSYIKLNHLA